MKKASLLTIFALFFMLLGTGWFGYHAFCKVNLLFSRTVYNNGAYYFVREYSWERLLNSLPYILFTLFFVAATVLLIYYVLRKSKKALIISTSITTVSCILFFLLALDREFVLCEFMTFRYTFLRYWINFFFIPKGNIIAAYYIKYVPFLIAIVLSLIYIIRTVKRTDAMKYNQTDAQ